MKTNALRKEALEPAGKQAEADRTKETQQAFRPKAARSVEEGQSDWQHVDDASKEKHYSIPEISTLWGLSEKTIRRIFQDEQGVVELGTEESRSKRAYITRRIPESVLRRVHRRLRKTA
jgi:AraC-like DNA-binding protein